MIPKGSWMVVQSTTQAPKGFDYDVFAVPEVEGGKGYRDFTMGAANGFAVGRTDNADISVEFLKYFTGLDMQLKMMKEAGIFPVVKGALTKATAAHPSQLKIAEYFLKARAGSGWVDDGWGYDTADAFETAIETVLQGGDPAKALQVAAESAAKIDRPPQ
jgi:ABC-type glycerol-3-phosphate transport system substrate-binding protein